MIWTSPIYRFIIPDILDDYGKQDCKQILIDVTDSVPPHTETRKLMAAVLDSTCGLLRKNPRILDFGAGKLRNTIYLLEKGYGVDAVEFEKIQESTEGKKFLNDAISFGSKFQKIIFPHEFFKSDKQYDLILLLNVCTIMPVSSERLLALQYCREKLSDRGYVLWYHLHRDPYYIQQCTPDRAIGDGYYMKPKNRYQTFYRDFETEEIKEIFFASGYKFIDKPDAGHNTALLFKKWGKKDSPISNILNAEIIRKYVKGDTPIDIPEKPGIKMIKHSEKMEMNIPNPEELKNEFIYIEALSELPAGKPYATQYHSLIAAILIRIFIPPLQNPKVEIKINRGLERIDMLMSNYAKDGFFNHLVNSHRIPAHFIPIECKNYNLNIENSQLYQLEHRLDPVKGSFGIMTYRTTASKEKLLQQCKTPLPSGKYMICLDDKDIKHLLNCKLTDDPDGINDFMDNKFQQLIY